MPIFHYNHCDVIRTSIAPQTAIEAGDHKIKVDYIYDYVGVGTGAEVVLYVDATEVARETLEKTIGYRMSLDETLDIGEDTGTSVYPADYGEEDVEGESSTPAIPFKFNGTLRSVTIEYTNPDRKMTPAERLKLLRGRARAAAAH